MKKRGKIAFRKMKNGIIKNERTLIVNQLKDLPKIAKSLISYAGDQKIWLFEGEMGAGKTTLIKAIGAQLGVKDNITSPTFSFLNVYQTQSGNTLYHFDFYRLQGESEALAIDYDTYLYSGCYCFIEWPSKIQTYIPQQHIKISITVHSSYSRSLQVKSYQ